MSRPHAILPSPAARVAAALATLAALLAAGTANAQTTYRWVDPASGRTVFSDQPPPAGARQVSRQAGVGPADDAAPQSYATRQAAEKFPVTLYTAADCVEPCKQARDLLNGRGVPFTEKLLQTNADIAELKQRLGEEAMAPTVAIGRQFNRGFEAGAWNNLLDLAGYPKNAPYGAKPSGVFSQ